MTEISIRLPGFMGFKTRTGKINIAHPIDAIRFTANQIRNGTVVSEPMAGDWTNFSKNVAFICPVAFTDKEYNWGNIPVCGRKEGTFSTPLYLWHANTKTTVRFDGFNEDKKKIFQSGYFVIHSELISPAAPSTEFVANINRVTMGSHPSNDLPVNIFYDIKKVPSGADSLSLSFITDQLYSQGMVGCVGSNIYAFTGHIWTGHGKVIGNELGKDVSIDAVIRAWKGGLLLGETIESFTLDRVKRA